MEYFLHILELIREEASVVLALGSGILVPTKANVKRLRRLAMLTITIKNVIVLILGHDDVSGS